MAPLLSPALVLASLATPYAVRARTLRRAGRPVVAWRVACFAAALAAFAVALSPPLDALADRRLAAHMVEHVLLGDVAPLLLVLACSGAVLAPLLRASGAGRLRALGHPGLALGLWLVDLYAWHLPVAYDAALAHPALHVLEHACFFWLGANLWLALLGPLPKPAWFGVPARLGYVVAAWLGGSGLGGALVFSGHPFYPSYVAREGAGALGDQSAAGAIMMVEQGAVAFVVFCWLFLALWRQATEGQELTELGVAHGVTVDGARVGRAVAADHAGAAARADPRGRRGRGGAPVSRARRITTAGALLVAAGLTGCGGRGQSTLNPHSGPAHDISTLFWWMLVAASVVFAGTLGFIVLAFALRHRRGAPLIGDREGPSRRLVVVFGVAIPFVTLIGVFIVANFAVASKTDAPAPSPRNVRVDVVGRQWWWEMRYPGTPAVTANELHIPVRTQVDVHVSSADVIHSFWVPELNRKIDMIPGHPNRVGLYADRPGRFAGQCAEYCGLQHAHMRLVVVAEPMDRYRAWLKAEAAPAAAPTGAQAQRGQQLFLANACASCHQIRGTAAQGRIGPDLTHLGERASLAALTIPNTAAELRAWISDPQHVKPGNRMPGLNLSGPQFDAIVAYLRELR